MPTTEKINQEIDKQLNAGFKPHEIKSNLLTLNFPEHEIDAALKNRQFNTTGQPAKKDSPGLGVVSLLVSVFFIINGSMRISSSPAGSILYNWGIILVCVGIAGVVWKTIDLVRR